MQGPLAIDNVTGGTPFSMDRHHVATLVQILIPQGITDDVLHAGFAAAETEHREVPGLLRKWAIHTTTAVQGEVPMGLKFSG